MKMEIKKTVFHFLLILNISLVLFNIYIYQESKKDWDNELTKLKGYAESFELYDVVGLNGLYEPNDRFYCVWTKNRTTTDIQKTDYHETCHELILMDKKHFCKEP